jgi:glycosyltransferase involved in cell wall biosynthesis
MQPPSNAPRAWVALAASLDVDTWARRHAAGEVPDRWPYGLDRLAAHGFALAPRQPLQGIGRQAARAGRQLGGYQWWEGVSRRPPSSADVALCWDERAGVPLALLQRRAPVATGVIWMTERRSATDGLARAALRRAGAVWALSSAQLPVLRSWGVADRRLHHLPFGVDADFFFPVGEPAEGLVVSVGNDRHRDHDTVVGAVSAVQSRHPGARLSLTTRAAVDLPAAVGDRVAYRDHRAVREEYRRAAVVAVALRPNLHVSGVTVALEAMACGRPVVVTDTPGMRDYVDDGRTGVLVPAGDAAAMARAVGGLLDDPDRADAMGAAGRAVLERRFTTRTQSAALATIVRAALG